MNDEFNINNGDNRDFICRVKIIILRMFNPERFMLSAFNFAIFFLIKRHFDFGIIRTQARMTDSRS